MMQFHYVFQLDYNYQNLLLQYGYFLHLLMVQLRLRRILGNALTYMANSMAEYCFQCFHLSSPDYHLEVDYSQTLELHDSDPSRTKR